MRIKLVIIFVWCLNNNLTNGQIIFTETERTKNSCDCKSLPECNPLNQLVQEKKFRALDIVEKCGFRNEDPLYCCPLSGRMYAVLYFPS